MPRDGLMFSGAPGSVPSAPVEPQVYVHLAGDTMTGALTVPGLTSTTTVQGQTGVTAGSSGATTGGVVTLNAVAANQRYLSVLTAGSPRMRFGLDSTAESGGNAGSNPFLNLYSDTGTLIGSAWSVNRSTLQSTIPSVVHNKTFAYTGGAASNFSTPFFISTGFSGTTDGAGWVNLHQILINNDTLNVGAQQALGFGGWQNWGGTGVSGGRTGFRWQLTQKGPAPGNANYQAGLFSNTLAYSSGGTDLWSGAAGVGFGAGIYVDMLAGALNYRGGAGLEIDYGIRAGASAAALGGATVIRWTTHAFSPPIWEADWAYGIGSASPANQAKFGYQVGLINGNWPIDATNGRLFGAGFTNNWHSTLPMQAPHGWDYYNVNLTRTILRGRGFSVLGSARDLPAGTVQVGGAYLSSSGATASLDVVGSVCTAIASIATGGANLIVGTPLIHDDTGTLAFVATVSGGAATEITLVANTGSAITPPANPVTFRVSTNSPLFLPGAPTAPTLNLTWTASDTLALQPSGGKIKSALLTDAANDGAAATAGVEVGEWYRNGSVMMQRAA